MAEAVTRISRQASDLGRTVSQLDKDTGNALDKLRELNRQALGLERRRLEGMIPSGAPGADPRMVEVLLRSPRYADTVQRLNAVKQEEARRATAEQGDQSRAEVIERRNQARAQARVSTDQALGQQWKQNQAVLREQRQALQDAEQAYERLNRRKAEGLDVDADELRASEDTVKQRRRATEVAVDEERALRREAGFRRMSLGGGGGGPGFRGYAGAFLGGAGIGGGSVGGLIAGAALGTLTWPLALASMLGMGTGWLVQQGRSGYRSRMGALENMIPITAMLGEGDPEDLINRATAGARRSNLYRPSDLMRAQGVRARGLGSTDISSVVAAALLSGRTPQQQAQVDVMMGTHGRRFDFDASMRLIAAYRASSMGGGGMQFLPAFEGLVPQVMASASGPFTRVDDAVSMAQLAAASRMGMPGIESPLARGQIGAAFLGSRNQFMSGLAGGGDVLSQIAFLAVRRLRGTSVAARLKAGAGVDVGNVLGIREAIERAPELEQQFPELTQSITEMIGQYFPDAETRGLAMLNRTGSAYLSRKLASGEIDTAARARPVAIGKRAGGSLADEMAAMRGALEAMRAGRPGEGLAILSGQSFEEQARAAAAEVSGSPAAGKVGQYIVVPEAQALEMGNAVGEKLGPVLTAEFNNLREAVITTLTHLLVHEQVPGSERARP